MTEDEFQQWLSATGWLYWFYRTHKETKYAIYIGLNKFIVND